MKKLKFNVIITLILCIAATFCACEGGFVANSSSDPNDKPNINDQKATLTFVAINDLHGYIDQNNYQTGGLANTKYLIDKMSAFFGDNDSTTTERDDVVLFANGDMFQGTAISNMSRGAAVVAAMNQMGFDGMGIGNHEFDWGLDTIYKYWDNQTSDTKANFPLVNSNISQKSADNTLIGDLSDDDNILPYTIVEKMGVKVGLIGAIGPCENSILKKMVTDYTFEDVTNSVKNAAISLKNQGADLISVNIHYGNADNPTYYDANRKIASLKQDGDYLVDVIFNGHTHTRQKASIERPDGSYLPVVQGGGYNDSISYVKLVYDKTVDKVTIDNYGYQKVSEAGKNYDQNVQQTISDYNDNLINSLPALATSAVTTYKSDFYTYVADIMLCAFDSDYSISNYGGIRSNGHIYEGKAIKESNLYEVIPFDNAVYFIEMQGDAIYRNFMKNHEEFNYYGVNDGRKDFYSLENDSEYYTVSIIDYVYTGTYFDEYRSAVRSETNTMIQLRELLIEDVKAYGDQNIRWNPSLGSRLTKHVW